MTVATASIIQPQNNGANAAAINAWGSAISGLFSGAGLVQASDTGQVNWAGTPTYPSGASADSLVGIEIWKLNDSLQASKPIFFKVQYRISFRSAGPVVVNAYIIITVGTSTDGAGNINSTLNSAVALNNLASVSNGAMTIFTGATAAFASSDGSYFTIGIGHQLTTGTNSGAGVFYFDRTRDSLGAISNEGAIFGGMGWGNKTSAGAGVDGTVNSAQHFIWNGASNTVASYGSLSANLGSVFPGYVPASMSAGSSIGVSTPPAVVNGKLLPPWLSAIAYRDTDISAGTTITVPVSGGNHTYYPLGAQFALADRLAAAASSDLALRYE